MVDADMVDGVSEVETNVLVDVEELLVLDFEGFLDLIAERAGHPTLMDIDYALEGVEGGSLVFKVTGALGND